MSSSPESPALSVQGLVKEYPGGVRAVDGLDVLVKPGEVFVFLGPNGAGKSTTIRCVVTLAAPTAGSIAVYGHDVLREPDAVRRLVGYVPQEVALDRYLTARQHLELSARLYGIPRREASQRIESVLELVELRDRADDGVKGFSGGMKKRLDIACGLLHRPRLLVLDEPTVGLDLQTRYKVWDFVRALRDEGVSVLLTTHDMEEADELADRIAIIDHGRVQSQGSSAELKASYGGEMVKVDLGREPLEEADCKALASLEGVREVQRRGRSLLFVTANARDLAPRVAEWFEGRAGQPLRGLSFGPPSLGDVFLRITGHEIRDES